MVGAVATYHALLCSAILSHQRNAFPVQPKEASEHTVAAHQYVPEEEPTLYSVATPMPYTYDCTCKRTERANRRNDQSGHDEKGCNLTGGLKMKPSQHNDRDYCTRCPYFGNHHAALEFVFHPSCRTLNIRLTHIQVDSAAEINTGGVRHQFDRIQLSSIPSHTANYACIEYLILFRSMVLKVSYCTMR